MSRNKFPDPNVGDRRVSLWTRLVTRAAYVPVLCICVQVVWQYSNLWCSVYPLSSIDSIGEHGRTSQYWVIRC